RVKDYLNIVGFIINRIGEFKGIVPTIARYRHHVPIGSRRSGSRSRVIAVLASEPFICFRSTRCFGFEAEFITLVASPALLLKGNLCVFNLPYSIAYVRQFEQELIIRSEPQSHR